MKHRFLYLPILMLLTLLGISAACRSQAVAQWTFNSILTGTGSGNVVASSAALGPGISTAAFNGGTVYYGEDGWPTGPLDPNAYLEFTVKPVTAYSLTISSMQMNIRRSTTGTGAGPNNWTLRSSLDNYAADISGGTLTTNSSAAIPVTFNASYANLSAPVTFRIYGYNVTMTTGGLNRFVFDNISIGGSTILPLSFGPLSAVVAAGSVNLDWTVPPEQDLAEVLVQRGVEGGEFQTLALLPGGRTSYHYTDNTVTGGWYAYRIAMKSADNDITYSPVKLVTFQAGEKLTVQGISSGSGASLVRIYAPVSGAYRFTLYNMNGYPIIRKSSNLSAGTQTVDLGADRIAKGIYIIRAESGGQVSTGRLMIP